MAERRPRRPSQFAALTSAETVSAAYDTESRVSQRSPRRNVPSAPIAVAAQAGGRRPTRIVVSQSADAAAAPPRVGLARIMEVVFPAIWECLGTGPDLCCLAALCRDVRALVLSQCRTGDEWRLLWFRNFLVWDVPPGSRRRAHSYARGPGTSLRDQRVHWASVTHLECAATWENLSDLVGILPRCAALNTLRLDTGSQHLASTDFMFGESALDHGMGIPELAGEVVFVERPVLAVAMALGMPARLVNVLERSSVRHIAIDAAGTYSEEGDQPGVRFFLDLCSAALQRPENDGASSLSLCLPCGDDLIAWLERAGRAGTLSRLTSLRIDAFGSDWSGASRIWQALARAPMVSLRDLDIQLFPARDPGAREEAIQAPHEAQSIISRCLGAVCRDSPRLQSLTLRGFVSVAGAVGDRMKLRILSE